MDLHSSVALAFSCCLLACASGDLNNEHRDRDASLDAGDDDTSRGRPTRDTGTDPAPNPTDSRTSDVVTGDTRTDVPEDSGLPPADATPDSADPGEVTLRTLVIPTEPSSVHLHALDPDGFVIDVPLPDCSVASGQLVPANAYLLNNPEAVPVLVSVSLRTRAQEPTLDLPSGAIFLYGSAALGTPGGMCTISGTPADGYASQVRNFAVPASGAIGILVSARSPGAGGSYVLTIHRGDSTPPEELPDPETVCTDTCAHARNFVCNDGGDGSLNGDCPYGTDCSDCGERLDEG